MRPISRSILVTTDLLIVPVAAGQVIYFQDVPELRDGVIVEGFELYTSDEAAFTPALIANVTAADAARMTVSFQEMSTTRIKDIPLIALNSPRNGGIWKELEGFLVNWQASFVRTTAALAAGTNFAVCGSVFYRKLSDLAGVQRRATVRTVARR